MPTAAIPIDDLNRYLPRALSSEQLESYLEQLGCDLDGFMQIHRIQCQNCQALQELNLSEELPPRCPDCGHEDRAKSLWLSLGKVEVVRMDLLPVRPDIFDAGGLGRAIRGLMGEQIGLPRYDIAPPIESVVVDASVDSADCHRPHIACAIIRQLQLDDISLRIVMKLQENLHWALGRDRKLASIGVYELDAIQFPIKYTAIGREDIRFTPLQPQQPEPLTPQQILDTHPKGTNYRHLLDGFTKVPLLIDNQKQVLSMPPIINSHETRISLQTKAVFIDVTGISERVVQKTLHTLVTSMLELFPNARAEQLRIAYPHREEITPSMQTEHFALKVSEANRRIGFNLDLAQAAELLRQMRHDIAPLHDDPDAIAVTVAPYRNDIMHEVDLIEDLAIAYGYQNLTPLLVPTMTVAQERPERVLANRVRTALTGLGFFESMSLLLSNPAEQYDLMRITDEQNAVLLENPVSSEQTMLRTALMPQLLKLFALNRGQTLPQRIFEVDDVVKLYPEHEHPIEELHVVGGILNSEVGFADIKAVVASLCRELQMTITLSPLEHPAMIPGRAAQICFQDQIVGMMGEIHPAVLDSLRLAQPLVAFEIDISPLLPKCWNQPMF
jgi:phenylalanyl-tRNA synthetase beta chain